MPRRASRPRDADLHRLRRRGALAAVGAEALRVLSPLGVEAALAAAAVRKGASAEARRQAELALTQARYEADSARRQYDATGPVNRLVVPKARVPRDAAELERRWNDRLAEVQRRDERLAAKAAARPAALAAALAADERDRLPTLGADLERAWTHPGTSAETRIRILRAVLEEIVVTPAEGRIELLLHWSGGDHSRLAVPRNRTGRHRRSSDAEVCDLIRALARQQADGAVAATLNRLGKRTGRGNAWTETRVRSFRSHHKVPAHRPGEMAERGELTLEEAARRLGVSEMTVLRLIRTGALAARQVCKGAPWAIPEAPLAPLAGSLGPAGRPRTSDPAQDELDLQ